MYSGPQLIELLEQQHQGRHAGLLKKGTFSVQWRAKVGSFPHPDGETMVSAGEPCGPWEPAAGCPRELHRPEDKRNVGENWEYFEELPLNGYIPGSGIRGLVRSWAKNRPEVEPRMRELLGYQDDDREKIVSGKFEFLDAWPVEPTKVTLDIVNPQQDFQVFHKGQSTPLSSYTLGDGEEAIAFTVAIRGIPGKASPEEVAEVWGWVEEAIALYGLGSRTASGYGAVKPPASVKPKLRKGYSSKTFDFTLYSQGNAGPHMKTMELRPTHWRGWLRSWVLRFLLGVMSKRDAEETLGELMGVLEPETRQGSLRLEMEKRRPWGLGSEESPYFYVWEGRLKLSAPTEILNKIILPIVRIAVMVGGVGRGWRRPLHIFVMNNGREAARGSLMVLRQRVKKDGKTKIQLYGLPLKPAQWGKLYQDWLTAVRSQWPQRVQVPPQLSAEVFSPTTCGVYAVPGPDVEPLYMDAWEADWEKTEPLYTRGKGVELIYKPTYKRKRDVGGDAAGGGNAHCSWASIKRVNVPHPEIDTECQEVVCLFMGDDNNLREQFLRELKNLDGAVCLFGV